VWNTVKSDADLQAIENSGNGLAYSSWDATSGTNTQINIGDTFKEVTEYQINVGDSWRTVTEMKLNVNDEWKSVF
jgi:hypothetical protein